MSSSLATKTAWAFAMVSLVGACGSSAVTPEGAPKGVIDLSLLEKDGVAVTLDGSLGSITIPLATPLPAADDAALQSALWSAALVSITNPRTGVSANLSDGVLVSGTPQNPGELAWVIDETRSSVTFVFFNQTVTGATLKLGQEYTVALELIENVYVAAVPATSFNVIVQ